MDFIEINLSNYMLCGVQPRRWYLCLFLPNPAGLQPLLDHQTFALATVVCNPEWNGQAGAQKAIKEECGYIEEQKEEETNTHTQIMN